MSRNTSIGFSLDIFLLLLFSTNYKFIKKLMYNRCNFNPKSFQLCDKKYLILYMQDCFHANRLTRRSFVRVDVIYKFHKEIINRFKIASP